MGLFHGYFQKVLGFTTVDTFKIGTAILFNVFSKLRFFAISHDQIPGRTLQFSTIDSETSENFFPGVRYRNLSVVTVLLCIVRCCCLTVFCAGARTLNVRTHYF